MGSKIAATVVTLVWEVMSKVAHARENGEIKSMMGAVVVRLSLSAEAERKKNEGPVQRT
jgi:hypothetical protein